MINIEKSLPAPNCLVEEKHKKSGTYRTPTVISRLKNDFKNKCYICEYKEPPTINIEHFIPHQGDINLKFDWDNLFWACAHCNNIKLAKYDNILNCIDPNEDVENWIEYYIDPYPMSKVKITLLKLDDKVKSTVELLEKVYNGSTDLKRAESYNIRQKLLKEIILFQKLLFEYFEDNDPEDKAFYLRKIKRHLKKSSNFTAFKRWIIKKNLKLRNEFEQYFD